jgi:hypothetical protein
LGCVCVCVCVFRRAFLGICFLDISKFLDERCCLSFLLGVVG